VLRKKGRSGLPEYQALQQTYPCWSWYAEAFPEVLEFFEARLDVYRIARRLEVAPPPPDAPATLNARGAPAAKLCISVNACCNGARQSSGLCCPAHTATRHARALGGAGAVRTRRDERERLLNEFLQELDLIETAKPKVNPMMTRRGGMKVLPPSGPIAICRRSVSPKRGWTPTPTGARARSGTDACPARPSTGFACAPLRSGAASQTRVVCRTGPETGLHQTCTPFLAYAHGLFLPYWVGKTMFLAWLFRLLAQQRDYTLIVFDPKGDSLPI